MADKKKKSIIEEALLDINRIQEALEANTKGILRSVAHGEIDGIVESALTEDDYEEDDVDMDYEGGETASDDYEDSDDMATGDDDMESDDLEGEDDLEGGGEDFEGGDDEMGDEYEGGEMDMTAASDEDVIAVYKKMSGDDEIEVVSDNEVHIKPAGGEEFIVKMGGGAPEAAEIGGDDLEGGAEDEDGFEMEGMYEGDESVNEDEVVYEITLDEDDAVTEGEEFGKEIGKSANGKPRTASSDVHMGGESKAPQSGDIDDVSAPEGNENDDNWAGDNLEGGFDDEGQNGSGDAHAEHVMENEDVTESDEVTETEEVNEEELEENLGSTRGYAGRQGAKMGGDDHHPSRKDESVELQEKYNALAAKYNKLVDRTNEYKSALGTYKKKLAETVVFNSNLTYAAKLFMEHSTTQEEKVAILKRFDEGVSNITESKRMYKTIKNELSSKKPISESLDSRINESRSSAVSATLNESTAYAKNETNRILDLMKRVENK